MVRNHIKGVPGVGADAIDPSTYLGAFNLLHAAPRDGASFFPSFFLSFFLPLSLSLSLHLTRLTFPLPQPLTKC